jgi:dihydrofolate reductase
MYLSYVKGDYDGDAFFPQYDEGQWRVEKREGFPDFELVTYVKK